ncbi:Vascular endothelial growth factor B [Armadillidium nasatum]|uniref:Vascular endothelial growth factor B n=1 Tax=Armadillidium nasatum TaxID=96803 RepID=A0A5N5T6Q9_9CRUS|nr:Vascular endothelial growth factor B [Armadillidium nasatum]
MSFPKFLIFFVVLIKTLEAASTQPKSTIIFPEANANGNFNSPKELPTGTSFLLRDDEIHISKNELSEANFLSKIKDFATFYNISLPKVDKFKLKPSIFTRVGGSSPFVQDLAQATCEPEMHPVPLNLPQEEGITYFPTCVRVKRCGGCCFLSHHSCQPSSVQTIKVKVLKVGDTVTRSRRRVNRQAEQDYISVDVEEHNSCDCKCKLKESECNPAIQTYSEPQCECLCKDKDKEEACLGSRDHFWSYEQCECLCRKTISCSSGQEFDHKTCRCVNTQLELDYSDLYNDGNFLDYFYN